MDIRQEHGLPVAAVELKYGENQKIFQQVLIDTGCAITVFDTDLLAEIGLEINFAEGIPTIMYGVGGEGEICNQQKVSELYIDHQRLEHYPMQFGIVRDRYGFDGIIGFDFMRKTGMKLDFQSLLVSYPSEF